MWTTWERWVYGAEQHDRNMWCELKGLCHVQGKGKSIRAWQTSNKHKATRWGKWGQIYNREGKICNASEYDCHEPWLWMIRLRKNDFKCQKMKKNGDSKCLNDYVQRLWKPKLKEDGGIECQAGQWLWMPKWRHDFECQNEDMTLNAKLKKMVALNSKLKTWLWMLKIDESGFEW